MTKVAHGPVRPGQHVAVPDTVTGHAETREMMKMMMIIIIIIIMMMMMMTVMMIILIM